MKPAARADNSLGTSLAQDFGTRPEGLSGLSWYPVECQENWPRSSPELVSLALGNVALWRLRTTAISGFVRESLVLF